VFLERIAIAACPITVIIIATVILAVAIIAVAAVVITTLVITGTSVAVPSGNDRTACEQGGGDREYESAFHIDSSFDWFTWLRARLAVLDDAPEALALMH
jgi:hypothetical protein